jgi:hypothetical protein
MNIGPMGVLRIWLDLLWLMLWPIPLALFYTFLFRNSLSKRFIFFIVAVGIGFAVTVIYELGFLKLVVVDPAHPRIENLYDNAKLISFFLLIPKILSSLFLYWMISKLKVFGAATRGGCASQEISKPDSLGAPDASGGIESSLPR